MENVELLVDKKTGKIFFIETNHLLSQETINRYSLVNTEPFIKK